MVTTGITVFCRWRRVRWCEDHQVNYIVGLAKNARLRAKAQPLVAQAQADFQKDPQKQRLFGEMSYAADPWDRERRVLVKAEHTGQGSSSAFCGDELGGGRAGAPR